MLIDCHVHAFPDKIVSKAISSLSEKAGGLKPAYDGSVSDLIKYMDTNGVDVACVLNIATNARQMKAVNNFAKEINSDRIVAFGSVFPDAEDVLDELDRIKELGLKGVKFHPEYQSFYVNDKKMEQIYKKISSLGLIAVFHAGGDLGFRPPYHCTPKMAVEALKMLDTPVIFAHWGGYMYQQEVIEHLAGSDAYLDVSFGHCVVPKPVAEDIINKHGIDKFLFASDGPWHKTSDEKIFIESLDISKEDKEKIFYKNAIKLLDLE